MNEHRRSTCVHEAGHAVACVVLGCQWVELYLEPTGGQTLHISNGMSPEDQVVVTLSGPLAEEKAGFPLRVYGVSSDSAKLRNLMKDLTGRADITLERQPKLRELMLRAAGLTDQYWCSIERIANELQASGELGDDQIRAAIASADGLKTRSNPPAWLDAM